MRPVLSYDRGLRPQDCRVPVETGVNTLHRSYKICNFTLTVLPHYPKALKPHFEVNCCSILLINSKSESCQLSELYFYRLLVFGMKFFCQSSSKSSSRKSVTFPQVFDQNFVFKTQHVSFN